MLKLVSIGLNKAEDAIIIEYVAIGEWYVMIVQDLNGECIGLITEKLYDR